MRKSTKLQLLAGGQFVAGLALILTGAFVVPLAPVLVPVGTVLITGSIVTVKQSFNVPVPRRRSAQAAPDNAEVERNNIIADHHRGLFFAALQDIRANQDVELSESPVSRIRTV